LFCKTNFSKFHDGPWCSAGNIEWENLDERIDQIRQIIGALTFSNKSKSVSEHQDSLHSLWNYWVTCAFEESNSLLTRQIHRSLSESRIVVPNLGIAWETCENHERLHWGKVCLSPTIKRYWNIDIGSMSVFFWRSQKAGSWGRGSISDRFIVRWSSR
jgi:hypothetical protein